ncbi:hypothetical protein [Thermoflavimicrobium daqui]|jgi:hypothetical protein|uniref:NERD domain-containing protein n=1 Tax=Thermoflavimicrobium daqui TaxID=2137476 RepID=A0A364K9N5_9BACL|nr:hypothetical protein [Thermoflavimicrobium daqui]RAL27016.1 hypothetical protein DL897_02965 [Thermoflavimicrobium daqui]
MADSIPIELSKQDHPENKLLFQTLKKYLPNDHLILYQQNLYGYQPDFIIFGPDLGLFVLEVEYLSNLSTWYFSKLAKYQINSSAHFFQIPTLLRARNYVFQISKVLQQSLQAIFKNTCITFPYGYGTIFPQLSKKNLQQKQLGSLLQYPNIMTREEIDPNSSAFSSKELTERFKIMIKGSHSFTEPLFSDAIKSILLQDSLSTKAI